MIPHTKPKLPKKIQQYPTHQQGHKTLMAMKVTRIPNIEKEMRVRREMRMMRGVKRNMMKKEDQIWKLNSMMQKSLATMIEPFMVIL